MAIFHRLVQAPDGVVPGTAKISIEFASWDGRPVSGSAAYATVVGPEEPAE